ncbi:response regulator [Pedobacter alpinus]|uniref:Response regulator n=1 Tax=Pedobacter alpinus TaxID=1590643 RepID=A0ABW5TUJ9_9SPHI
MNKSIKILLVEDNEGDIYLTKSALKEGKIINEILIERDGQAAVNFLEKCTNNVNLKPNLILLDMNLPKLNGIEVLKYIKTNNELKHIPVIMLTTSSFEQDIVKSYKNYANCYITKPIDVKDFIQVVEKIEDFWISIVQLP